MSDMDVFEGKVSDIREHVADQPMSSFAQLRARARRRRAKHRVGGVAAIAAVALAVVAVPVALHQFGGHKAAPVAGDGPVKGPLASVPIQLAAIKKVVGNIPLDPRTAYAVVQAKDGKYGMVRTLDGRSWQAWTFPAGMQQAAATDFAEGSSGGSFGAAAVRPLDNPLVIDRLVIRVGRSLSRDGGETWTPITAGQAVKLAAMSRDNRPITERVGDAVSTAPAKWPVAMLDVDAANGKPRSTYLAAVDPATGVWHRLANSPMTRPSDSLDGVRADPTGALWVTYRTLRDSMAGHMVLAVSHDRGRTWIRHPIPEAGQFVLMPPLSVDGQHAVVPVQYGPQPEVDQKWMQYGVLITDDGGRTWRLQRTHGQTTPGNGAKGPALPDDALMLPDGSFIGVAYGEPPKLIRTHDYGDTQVPFEGTDGAFAVQRTITGGYLLMVAAKVGGVLHPTVKVSDDGLHWQPVPVSPVAK